MSQPDLIHEYAATVAQVLEIPDTYFFGFADTVYALFEPLLTPFEAYVKEALPTASDYAYDYAKKNTFHTPPRDIPLLNPSHVLFTGLAYFVGLALFGVLGLILGKRKYRLLNIVHNCFLFLLSLYMAVGLIAGRIECGYAIINQPPTTERGPNWRVAKVLWIFYASKVYEFGDTFIMMLTQSYRQVSFLHVYHHVSMLILVYIMLMVSPNGEPSVPSGVNSCVHVIMYGYYAGTSVFPDPNHPVRHFLNNIKFMITKGQLLQFLVCFLYSSLLYTGIITPKIPTFLYTTNFYYQATMMVLFGNFLIVNQRRTAKAKKSDKKVKG